MVNDLTWVTIVKKKRIINLKSGSFTFTTYDNIELCVFMSVGVNWQKGSELHSVVCIVIHRYVHFQ